MGALIPKEGERELSLKGFVSFSLVSSNGPTPVQGISSSSHSTVRKLFQKKWVKQELRKIRFWIYFSCHFLRQQIVKTIFKRKDQKIRRRRKHLIYILCSWLIFPLFKKKKKKKRRIFLVAEKMLKKKIKVNLESSEFFNPYKRK